MNPETDFASQPPKPPEPTHERTLSDPARCAGRPFHRDAATTKARLMRSGLAVTIVRPVVLPACVLLGICSLLEKSKTVGERRHRYPGASPPGPVAVARGDPIAATLRRPRCARGVVTDPGLRGCCPAGSSPRACSAVDGWRSRSSGNRLEKQQVACPVFPAPERREEPSSVSATE